MNMINIRNVDMNLLVVFEALARTQNVSKAATQLNLTQSAVSHALARLRDQFNDPLFVRSPRGIVPTPRANDLRLGISAILEKTEALFNVGGAFNPKTHDGIFQLCTTDYSELVLLPRFFDHLSKEAPNVKVISRPTPSYLPKSALESGEADIAVAGFYGDLPPGFYQQKVFEDEFVVLARKKHPRMKGTMTLEKYLREDHIRIAMHGNLKGEFDTYLEKKGIKRNVVAGLSNFTSPAWILAETDFLLTAPRKLAERYCEYLPVQIFPAPMEIKKLTVMQVWHERTHEDPFQKWMRGELGGC